VSEGRAEPAVLAPGAEGERHRQDEHEQGASEQGDQRVAGQHRPAPGARGEDLLGVLVVLLAAQPQGGRDAVCGGADREELQLGREEGVREGAGVATELAQQLLHLFAARDGRHTAGDAAEHGADHGVPDHPAEQVGPLQPPGESPGRAQRRRGGGRSGARREESGAEVAALLQDVGQGEQQRRHDEWKQRDDEPVLAEDLDLLGPAER
jgi:hypothetical protein